MNSRHVTTGCAQPCIKFQNDMNCRFDAFILEVCVCGMQMNSFWGDLTDIQAELYYTDMA